jgi:hypothetical protein
VWARYASGFSCSIGVCTTLPFEHPIHGLCVAVKCCAVLVFGQPMLFFGQAADFLVLFVPSRASPWGSAFSHFQSEVRPPHGRTLGLVRPFQPSPQDLASLVQSDSVIVAAKPANKAERSAAELMEPRAETKGNAGWRSTLRTQSRACGSQALARMRQAFAVRTRGRSRMRESRTYGSGAARLAAILAGESPANRGVQSLL